jgi:hypothetical protein
MCRNAPLDVEVLVPAAHEHHGDGAIDHDAERRDPDHGCGFDRLRVGKAPESFHNDAAGGNQKQAGVAERCQNRGAAIAVSPAGGGQAARQPTRPPRQQQTDHVGQIVCGVGHQGERMRQVTKPQLGEYDHDVERDADGKRAVEARGRVAMGRAVVMVVMMRVCHAVVRLVLDGSGWRKTRWP